MIKELRIKFIMINMTIVSVLLCIILALVYYFTKLNMETADITMMQGIAEDPYQLSMPGNSKDNIRLPFFAVQLDADGTFVASGGGYFDLSDEPFLMNIVTMSLDDPKETGILDEYDLRFLKISDTDEQIIVFSDISSENSVLKNLIESCMFIGSTSFIAFLMLSIYLAKWATTPVNNAWNKQRQFVADASHELKTPLTVIMTNAELLQSPDYDENSRKRFVASILTMSKQMRSLVEQLLELARADNVQSDIIFTNINLSSLISDAVLPFEPVFFEKGLNIRTEIQPDIYINADYDKIRQVMDILLDNAQKYSKEKGTTWVRLNPKGKNKIILSVANEGDAISDDELKNLFKRFYRVDKARSRDGSFGLGLPIAEAIITNHKGKIWAESKNNVNSFFVELHS